MTSVAQRGRGPLDVEALLRVLRAFQAGDFDARLPDDWEGAAGQVAETVNDLIAITRHNTEELERVAQLVGEEGRIEERLTAAGSGDWARSVGMVNQLIENLVRADDQIAQVIGAVALGDLSQSVPMDVDGRPLLGHFATTARTVNTMVEQLSGFSSEVTRVAREVGTEGRLGGQARVVGVSGVWKDLTESVNQMADNLTAQVRNIAEVTTAVAGGDLSREITVEGR
ncbi:MAG: hybrid sensor histidine kinase/response regulator, partial [Candidatus Dormibacteraeota bacterium]|nr:hybrid sensor histidine kinase/response regulator [Candidatus Dormibacteraeota bacterium]